MRKVIIIFTFLVMFKADAQSSALVFADSLYTVGNYISAINAYSKVGTQNASLQIARAYNAIGNFDKAIAQYENVITKDNSVQIASLELGKLLLKIKDPNRSRAIFEKLTQNDADNPEYFFYLGRSLQELDNKGKSVSAFRKAVTLDSTHLRSIFQLGKYFVSQKEKDSVLRYVNLGLRFYEKDVGLINLKALALYNENDYEKATPLFEKLVELKEEREYILEKLAYCYFNLRAYEKAKSTYKALLKFDDTKPNALYNLGHVFWKQQQLDSAAIYIKEAIAVQEVSYEEEYGALARLAREQNDLKTALRYYKLAYEEDTSNFMNYYQVCFIADQYYKDPEVKLEYFKNFIDRFGWDKGYFSEFATKRISELREEIHFAKD